MPDINLLQDHESQEDNKKEQPKKTAAPQVEYTNPGKDAKAPAKAKKQNWVHFLDNMRNKRKVKDDKIQNLQKFPARPARPARPQPLKAVKKPAKPLAKDAIIPKKKHSWFQRNADKPTQNLVQDMKPVPKSAPVTQSVVNIKPKMVKPLPKPRVSPPPAALKATVSANPSASQTPSANFPKFTRARQTPPIFDPFAQVQQQTPQPPERLFRDEALVSQMDKMRSLDPLAVGNKKSNTALPLLSDSQPPKRNFFGPGKEEHIPAKPNKKLSNIDVNLMPRDVLNVVTERNESIMLGWVAMSSIIFVLLVFGGLTLYGYRLQSNTTDVNGKIETVNQEITTYTGLQNTAAGLKEQIDTVDGLLNKHVHWTQVLEKFQSKVVPNVVYRNINGDTKGVFKITAIAESFDDVAEQVRALQAADFVSEVSTTGGTKVTESALSSEGNVVVTDRGVEFTISVEIKPETFYLNEDL